MELHLFAEAVSAGAQHFQGNSCKRGHDGIRYTKGRACLECVRIARGGWLKTRKRSAANMSRAMAARDSGATIYETAKPCRHGHSQRFVASNNCVECDRQTQERQKIARKFSRIRKEYRLTKIAYLQMVEAQGSRCKICARYEEDHFRLHIDHCHSTGAVRGLLCGPCNQGIGLFKHSAGLMAAAIAYLSEGQ